MTYAHGSFYVFTKTLAYIERRKVVLVWFKHNTSATTLYRSISEGEKKRKFKVL